MQAPGGFPVCTAVIVVVDRNKPNIIRREDKLQKMSCFKIVSGKPGEIFDNNRFNLFCLYQFQKVRRPGTVKIGSRITVINDLFKIAVFPKL